MVSRSDLKAIGATDFQTFSAQVQVPPTNLDINFQLIRARYNTLESFTATYAAGLSEINIFTALQKFSAGINVDTIGSYTAGQNIDISTTASGLVRVGDATFALGRVLTTANINTLAPAGGVTDMVGANGSVAGVHGLVPQPAATDNNKFLRGDATFATVNTSSADVVGPGSATDKAIARFNTTTGKLLQNSSSTLDDSGYLTVNAYIAGTGYVNAQTGTTYTLTSSDNGREVTCSNASAITVTVTTTSIPADFTVIVTQLGAGQVSFTAGGSAVLRNALSQTKISGQYGVVRIKRVGSTNDFIISGQTGT